MVTAFFLLRTAWVLCSFRLPILGLDGSSRWAKTCSDIMKWRFSWSKSKYGFWTLLSNCFYGLEVFFRFSFLCESNRCISDWYASTSPIIFPLIKLVWPGWGTVNDFEVTPWERASYCFRLEFLYPPRKSASISLRLNASCTLSSFNYSTEPILQDGGSGVLIWFVPRESSMVPSIRPLPDVF